MKNTAARARGKDRNLVWGWSVWDTCRQGRCLFV